MRRRRKVGSAYISIIDSKNEELITPNSLSHKYRVAAEAAVFTQWLQALAIGTSNAAWLLYPPHMIKRKNGPRWTI